MLDLSSAHTCRVVRVKTQCVCTLRITSILLNLCHVLIEVITMECMNEQTHGGFLPILYKIIQEREPDGLPCTP